MNCLRMDLACFLMPFDLIAQAPLDPLGGWGTLLLQGGAFILLCYIVIKAFPQYNEDARKERKELAEMFKDSLNKQLADFKAIALAQEERFEKVVNVLQTRFAERNVRIEEGLAHLVTATEKQTDTFRQVVQAQTDSINTRLKDVQHAVEHNEPKENK